MHRDINIQITIVIKELQKVLKNVLAIVASDKTVKNKYATIDWEKAPDVKQR